MPIYVYKCATHGVKELLLGKATPQKCPECSSCMERQYALEKAGFPPFVSYTTEALSPNPVHIATRDEQRKWEKKTGFVRVS
jgi:putative FmdB family regulatory protein